MKQVFIICCLMVCVHLAGAQNQANIWYFGCNAGMDFNGGAPVPLTNGALCTNEGCASIADKNTGQLLFYTDGVDVWDATHNVMPNGSFLMGNFSSTQSAIIVPKPGSNTLYYIFTVDATAGFSGFAYSIVDITLNGGLGDITLKNQPLLTPTCEKVTATPHCNGTDIWVITHRWNSNAFYAYLLTAAGLSAPVVTNAGIVHQDAGSFSSAETIGYMKVSPDGKKLALACYIELNTIEIFDFDNSTGAVSNPATDSNFPNITGSDGPYGISFSPDAGRLYVTVFGYAFGGTSQLIQYDMNAGSGPAIIASRTLIASTTNYGFGGVQIGPDGKIYLAKTDWTTFVGSNSLDVINAPNALGAACNFSSNAFFLGGAGVNQSWWGLPDMVESIFSTRDTAMLTYLSSCGDTLRILFLDTLLSGNVNYAWNFGDPASGAGDTSSLQSPFHSFTAPGTYTVSLNYYNACINDTIVQSVTLPATITVSLGSDTFICPGDTLWVTPGAGYAAYSWSTGDTVAVLGITQPGTYRVLATDSAGCQGTDSVTVSINPVPVNIGNDTLLCQDSTLVLDAGNPGASYLWSTGDTSRSILVADSGLYRVDVMLGGCSGADSVLVSIEICEKHLYLPNAFTPNGDGRNEVFFPAGSGIDEILFLRIYNRWGEMIFERTAFTPNDADSGWDGTYKGKAGMQGIYVYYLEAVFMDGTAVSEKGHVLLLY